MLWRWRDRLSGGWHPWKWHILPEDCAERSDGFKLGCIGSCRGAHKGGVDGMQGMDDLVLRSWVWVGEVVWAEADGITDEDCMGLSGEDSVALVMLEGQAKVEAFQHMEVPGAADGWFMVDADIAARRAHGSGIKVVGPKEGLPCGRFGGVS